MNDTYTEGVCNAALAAERARTAEVIPLAPYRRRLTQIVDDLADAVSEPDYSEMTADDLWFAARDLHDRGEPLPLDMSSRLLAAGFDISVFS